MEWWVLSRDSSRTKDYIFPLRMATTTRALLLSTEARPPGTSRQPKGQSHISSKRQVIYWDPSVPAWARHIGLMSMCVEIEWGISVRTFPVFITNRGESSFLWELMYAQANLDIQTDLKKWHCSEDIFEMCPFLSCCGAERTGDHLKNYSPPKAEPLHLQEMP